MKVVARSVIERAVVDDERRLIRGTATTPRIDRMGDVVEPMGIRVARDVPLQLFHDATLIVGRASFDKPTAKGVDFSAWLPKIEEDGDLRRLVDKAWQLVKYGLIRDVSIGFRVLEDAVERMKGGGLRFLESEVLELSLVGVPANPDAAIAIAKTYDADRAALVERFDRIPRSPTGIHARHPGASGTDRVAHRGAVQLIPRKY